MNCTQIFYFKQFSVCQDGAAMKIGTDGILLGAWATHQSPENILDIGTGNGVIALMLAQRFPMAFIDALEIERKAYKCAIKNFKHSPWHTRLHGIHSSLQKFKTQKKYDLIVSNPPFFDEKVSAKNTERQTARQSAYLDLESIFSFASEHLTGKGNISLIYPKTKENKLIEKASFFNLYPSEILSIKGNHFVPSKRVLIKFTKNQITPKKDTLIIEKQRHVYTDEYIRLVKEFYLKM